MYSVDDDRILAALDTTVASHIRINRQLYTKLKRAQKGATLPPRPLAAEGWFTLNT